MATQTFELVSPFLTIYAPSKKLVSTQSSLLLGQTSNKLLAGELLELTGANGVQRPTYDVNAAGANKALEKVVFPFFSETGRGDIVTSGNVPILQFGPFEADTMLFERASDATFDANSIGNGDVANGKHANIVVGARVYAMPVRNPLTNTLSASDFVIGVGASVGAIGSNYVVGRVSRIIGTGASQKVRVMFGLN
tara:strand:+ start:2102 stop:2686 length:585 start_codon:yes stop_codon:yes gene_type:complete